MTRLALIVASGALAVGALAACAGSPGASSSGHGGSSGGHHGESETLAAEQLVGTWVVDATFETPTQPYLTIIDDGTWRGSDGCNGVQGTWELASSGTLEVTAGPTTMIYCEGKALPTLFSEAKTAAVADETLTLMDGTGEVTATLIAGREEIIQPN
jgi:heat shock protein HslJ